MNSVIGYHTTKFGELWEKSLFDLVEESIEGVLKSTKLEAGQIDAVFFGNMLGGMLDNSLLSSARIAEIMGVNIPMYRVEAACASGGMAFQMAHEYLKANPNKTVLVLGAEKMTDVGADIITKGLSSASAEEEQTAGLTFPGLYGMIAQVYLQKYGYTEENLAAISVKNHYHGSLNDKAHFRCAITLESVMKSSYVAYPLKVLDSSGVSDGAAGVIITNDKLLITNSKYNVNILSSQIGTDTISLAKRKEITELAATQIASEKALQESSLARKEIGIVEAHDCFSIAEILAMEDLGFWERGKGGKYALEMSSQIGNGPVIVNTCGGLKAAGHPVGATGVKQIGELFLQLTNQAGARQVKDVKSGLAHNVGGSGGVAVVSILGV